MRYRLRTLLIVLALGPPVLAGVWFASLMLGVRNVALIGVAIVPVFILALGFAFYCAVAVSEAPDENRSRVRSSRAGPLNRP